jgi:hypothetical protein
LWDGDPAGAGTQILTTDGITGTGPTASVGWIFNYDLGLLFISNDFRASITGPLYIIGYRYIGNTGVASAPTIAPVDAATTGILPDTPTYNPAGDDQQNAGSGANSIGTTLVGTTAGGGITIDGIALSVGDRILVKDQADARENGVYEVTDDGTGATPYELTRATDADEDTELLPNSRVFVAPGGTANGSRTFTLYSPVTTIVFGNTPQGENLWAAPPAGQQRFWDDLTEVWQLDFGSPNAQALARDNSEVVRFRDGFDVAIYHDLLVPSNFDNTLPTNFVLTFRPATATAAQTIQMGYSLQVNSGGFGAWDFDTSLNTNSTAIQTITFTIPAGTFNPGDSVTVRIARAGDNSGTPTPLPGPIDLASADNYTGGGVDFLTAYLEQV